MPNSEVEFNPAIHEYRKGGRVYLSVTTVLKRAGYLRAYQTMDPFYAERGTAVHLATEFEDKGTLDLDALDERILPYLEQYRDFKRTTGAVIKAIEEKFVDDVLGYAGTRDRIVEIRGKSGVLDIKTGRPSSWHPVQTAGYARPLWTEDQSFNANLGRWALYLPGERGERFKLIEHKDPLDFVAWNAALVVAQDQRRRGID